MTHLCTGNQDMDAHGNSKHCSNNKTKKSDDDNKVSDIILGSDFNTSSDHFCKIVPNNGHDGESLAQENNSVSSLTVDIPNDVAPAISDIGNLLKPTGQPNKENIRREPNVGIPNQRQRVFSPGCTSNVSNVVIRHEDPLGLITTYYEQEGEDEHGHNGLTAHAQAAHTQDGHDQAADADVLNMTGRRVHTTTGDNMTAVTAHSPASTIVIRDHADRSVQFTSTGERFNMNAGTVESTEDNRSVQCTGTETVPSPANSANISARSYTTDTRKTDTLTAGSSTHIISSSSSADVRSGNNTSATVPHSQETRNTRQGRCYQASRVIGSDPVRIESQAARANHLTDLIQQHLHQNGENILVLFMLFTGVYR